MRQKKVGVKEIAKEIGRHKSTVYRELKRNTRDFNLGYLPDTAQDDAKKRKKLHKLKISSLPELKMLIIENLKEGWSPNEIAGRLKEQGHPFLVSCETIYQWIYSAEGKNLGMFRYLLRGRPNRGLRHDRKVRKSIIPERVSIHDRPKHIETREEFGHLEGDTTFFKDNQSMNIAVIVEKKTRFIKLILNQSKQTSLVIQGMFKALVDLPSESRKTMTLDNGSEFVRHTVLQRFLGLKTYFCDKHSPWQKGLVEQTNAMLHRYLPKKANLKTYSPWQIEQIELKMNSRPRKCLGFRTPLEAFNQELSNFVALRA